jgi:hypothetical protein
MICSVHREGKSPDLFPGYDETPVREASHDLLTGSPYDFLLKDVSIDESTRATIYKQTDNLPTTTTTTLKRTVLKLQNLGHPNTNCTASNKLLFPLPFLPTTQFISEEKGWISGWFLKERKLERVIDLMCMIGYYC